MTVYTVDSPAFTMTISVPIFGAASASKLAKATGSPVIPTNTTGNFSTATSELQGSYTGVASCVDSRLRLVLTFMVVCIVLVSL